MKRFIAIVASLALCATLGACQAAGQSGSTDQQQQNASQSQSAQSPTADDASKDGSADKTPGAAEDAGKDAAADKAPADAPDTSKPDAETPNAASNDAAKPSASDAAKPDASDDAAKPSASDAAKPDASDDAAKPNASDDAAKLAASDDPAKSDKDSDKAKAASKKPDYAKGTHHATLKIEDYGTVKIEVRSDFAPITAEEFCLLVEKKYYDGKELYWFLTDIYAQLGTEDEDEKDIYKIRGEFDEAGVDNRLSLKRGTIAMSRTEDGRSSDASSLILFLSDCSYLDGKYAAFARITDGMEVFDDISAKVNSESKKERIDVSKNGQILESKDRPVVKSLRMVD